MIIEDRILKQTPLAEGGEGIIYDINNKILKVYKDNVNKQEKLEKLKALMNKSLPQNILKPLDIAYNTKKQFIGYIMEKVDGEDFKRLSSKKFLKLNNITNKDILKMLVDIKNTLAMLHNQDIYISDLNDCNILFDKKFNIYFIDVDSWSIDQYRCPVCMDSFKDPLLVNNEFSNSTDYYAFSILLFKSLTKLHPFGGTMNPDIDIVERMKKGISVIDNNNITVPKTITKWTYISPKLLEEMKEIFNTNKRVLLDKSLEDFYNNLKYCNIHNEYFYSKFNECPLCNISAKVITTPVKVATANGIPCILLVSGFDINTMLNENSYLDINNFIVHKKSNKKVEYIQKNKYYFSDNGEIEYVINNCSVVINYENETYKFEKINKSNVITKDDKFYYVSLNNNIVEVTVSERGNFSKNIAKVSFNNIFDFYDKDNYLICNIYDGMKIINISGYNYTLMNNDDIVNYGIHYDSAKQQWLLILENSKGKFNTYIFDKNKIVYQNDNIKYITDLSNLCINNGTIFRAGDKSIMGFNYGKNLYKDFNCDVVNEDSVLIKEGNKFIIINEKEVYRLG